MISTFDLNAPEYQSDPFPFYARMREEGLSRIEPGGFLAVTRYADVVAAFRNYAVFTADGLRKKLEPPWVGSNPCAHSMHSLDPPEHTKLRNLVSTAFVQSVIDRTAPFIRDLAENAVNRFAARGEADIVADIGTPVSAGTLGHFMAIDPALHSKFKGWAEAMLSITAVPKSPEHEKVVLTSLDELFRYVTSLIEAARRAPGDDMAGRLVKAEVDGQRLSDEELTGFLSLLLISGVQSTTNLVAKSLIALIDRPDVMDRVRADLSLVPAFVDEMLRYEPPVHSLPRFVKTDTQIAGHDVPAGSTVLLMVAAANRDEHQFPDPDVLDIDRDPRGSLAFGFGPHFCIGAALARLEGRIMLTELLRRFRRFEHLEPSIAWSQTFTVREPKRLLLRGVLA